MNVNTRHYEGAYFVCCSAEYDCPKSAWKCHQDNKCIQREFVCDGYVDCSDGADEKNCGKLVIMTVMLVLVVIVAAWTFDFESICMTCLVPRFYDAEDGACLV